jgi:hypothetical protein
MKKTWLLALLCVALALSVPLVRTVAANDDDDDDIDDEIEEAEKRELSVEVSATSVKIESEIKKEGMENEFNVIVETGEGIGLKLKFSHEVEQDENETEAELELKVKFLALVEYIDDGDSRFDPTKDTIIQTMDLTQLDYLLTWKSIKSADNENGYEFRVWHLGSRGFNFTVIAWVFPKHAIVDDMLIKPTETKITIIIVSFPYLNETSSLVLQISAVSKMELKEETETEEKEVNVKSETAEGYFSWSPNATVDGLVKPVNSSITRVDEETIINLSYSRGAKIVHDPRLGVSLLLGTAGVPWIYLAAGAAIIALAVAIGIKVFRPKMLDLASLRVYLTKGEP